MTLRQRRHDCAHTLVRWTQWTQCAVCAQFSVCVVYVPRARAVLRSALLCFASRTTLGIHFISFHFISFHFISFHFISFHFISFHFISFHFISFHFISFHFISFHFISFHFISFHFISFHFISFHFISFHFISFHFISFHFISFHFIHMPTQGHSATGYTCARDSVRAASRSVHGRACVHCALSAGVCMWSVGALFRAKVKRRVPSASSGAHRPRPSLRNTLREACPTLPTRPHSCLLLSTTSRAGAGFR